MVQATRLCNLIMCYEPQAQAIYMCYEPQPQAIAQRPSTFLPFTLECQGTYTNITISLYYSWLTSPEGTHDRLYCLVLRLENLYKHPNLGIQCNNGLDTVINLVRNYKKARLFLLVKCLVIAWCFLVRRVHQKAGLTDKSLEQSTPLFFKESIRLQKGGLT
jgi:hypothetical protein